MVRIIDTGLETEALIATETLTVVDPVGGFQRKIIAGQPVPRELIAAYNEASGSPKKPPKRSAKKK